ncbi:MAG: LysR substrate-binding domain-containing protein [Alphaproteobacteria bacterium]
MRIKSLKTLLFLADNGCDFGGHRIIGIPRSTMWSHVSEMEVETGLKLVHRRKQNSCFTEEGKNFIPYARSVLRSLEEGIKKAKQTDDCSTEGTLVISTTKALCGHMLLGSIRDFHVLYPNMRVFIIGDDYLAKNTETSVNILLRPLPPTFDFDRLWYVSYHHGLYASKEYLQKAGVPKVPEDLLEHCIIGYGEHAFTYFDEINWHLKGKVWGLPKLTPILTVNSTTSLFYSAVEDIGICSTSQEAARFYKGNLVRVLPKIEGPVTKTWYCINPNDPAPVKKNSEIFCSFFEQYLKQIDITISYA